MTKSASLSRHPWTTSMVWGWRLELQLGAATAALQLLSLDISPVGPILVLAAQVGILIKRPDIRARFETTASRQHEVAKLHYACRTSCRSQRFHRFVTKTTRCLKNMWPSLSSLYSFIHEDLRRNFIY